MSCCHYEIPVFSLEKHPQQTHTSARIKKKIHSFHLQIIFLGENSGVTIGLRSILGYEGGNCTAFQLPFSF